MLSQSAKAITAAEARFRVPYPNSRPRSAKLVALDRAGVGFVQRLVAAHPNRATLSLWPDADDQLADATARATHLIAALDTTDLVVMISMSGEDSPAASLIADACKLRKIAITIFVLDRDDLSDTLSHLRPYASMLIRAAGADYVEDMLAALRV
jgi:hypothetical protein